MVNLKIVKIDQLFQQLCDIFPIHIPLKQFR